MGACEQFLQAGVNCEFRVAQLANGCRIYGLDDKGHGAHEAGSVDFGERAGVVPLFRAEISHGASFRDESTLRVSTKPTSVDPE